MTSIFKLKFNSLAPFEKTGFVTSWSKGCHVILGMNFPKSLWNLFLGTFCVVKKYLYILSLCVGGGGGGGVFLAFQTIYALTCLGGLKVVAQ